MLARNIGLKPHTIRQIEKSVFQNKELLKEKFNEYHGH